MDKRRGYRGISVGIATVVVMFVVLAMTIFAVLSVSTAAQERRLAEKYAAAVTDYWAADAQCAALTNELGARWAQGADTGTLEALAAARGAACTWDGETLVVSYTAPAGESAALDAELHIGETFTVTSWRLTSADGDWSPDESLPVWQGEEST